MRTPRNRSEPIDSKRVRRWLRVFVGYKHSISDESVRDWIGQFEMAHHDLAARVLDVVQFFSHEQITAAFRSVLGGLEGWHRDEQNRQGKWRFIAYSASAGESGDSMLHKFRHANNLSSSRYNDLFIHRSDLLRARLGRDDSVVLIDDFVGSGDQACASWRDQFGELLTEVGRIYLVVVAARDAAITRIATETGLEVVPHHHLNASDNIFDGTCQHFTNDEQAHLLTYCQRANSNAPRGHGDCGLVVVFAHGWPNNSIPVLHASNDDWEGLFRRYD